MTQVGSMVDVRLRRGEPPRDYGDAANVDPRAFARYYHAMLASGILLAPSPNELMFLSTEHGAAEIDRTIDAAGEALCRDRLDRGVLLVAVHRVRLARRERARATARLR